MSHTNGAQRNGIDTKMLDACYVDEAAVYKCLENLHCTTSSHGVRCGQLANVCCWLEPEDTSKSIRGPLRGPKYGMRNL